MVKTESYIPRPETEKIQEACGVTGIFSKIGKNISPEIASLQERLQHRGQDSAGIATYTDGKIFAYTGLGKVSEVFPPDFDFEKHNLFSYLGIGHNRYGTSGEGSKDDTRGSQPVIGKYVGRELALAYNGNLPDEVRQKLKQRLPEDLQNSMFDTEDIANAIVSAKGDSWEEKIKTGLNGIDLAYSLTILTDDGRLFGLRGPSGTWPLWYGETDDKVIFASETRVYNKDNIKWKEVKPGELVEATKTGVLKKQIFEETQLLRCCLHDAYGARGDSLMTEDISYGDFRRELGRQLAREHPVDVDVIAGVPETGLVMAEGYAQELGKKPAILLTKNEEIRSFIAKDLDQTSMIVHKKYSVDKELARGKRVLLVDDSLIRGKTMGGYEQKKLKGVVQRVREEAGASEVHLAIALSKFVDGCDMGYYIKKGHLVAIVKNERGEYQERSEKEIAKIVGADSIHFLSIDGIQEVYQKILGKKDVACMACMGQPQPLEIIKSKKIANKATIFPVM